MSKAQKDYSVGYKKPPAEGQFVKGRSGNPSGRPRGRKGLSGMFMSIISEQIVIKENGRAKTISRIEAVLRQLINKALGGDRRALRDCIDLFRDFEELTRISDSAEQPMEREKIVFASILKRLSRLANTNDGKEK